MLDLEELQVFLAVAQTESFAGGARQLDMPTSTVSRRIASLEDRLDARLFTRTTRTVTLTDVGRSFLSHARQLVEHAVEAEQVVRSMTSEPTGLLRVTAPVTMSQLLVAEVIAKWATEHPRVEVELISTDRVVDLVAEGIDIAIREFPRKDTNLVARKLVSGQRLLVASPEYLAKAPPLEEPADLVHHSCVAFNFHQRATVWEVGDEIIEVNCKLSANDPSIALRWALEGLGIANTAHFLAIGHIRAGNLVQVLPHVEMTIGKMAVVYPTSRHLSPKVRSFVDFLVDHVRGLEQLVLGGPAH